MARQKYLDEYQDSPTSHGKVSGHQNVFDALLESSLPDIEKSEDRLTQEGIGLISAAAETTSSALMVTIFHTLRDTSLLSELRAEINSTSDGPGGELEWRKLENLDLLVSSDFP